MDEKERMNTEEYEELVKEVEANSLYKRLPSAKKKWMSVSEMGALLGLKKTDRYWLVHKNYFETKEIAGKKITIDGEAYLPSGYLVMKSDYGLHGLEESDINAVLPEIRINNYIIPTIGEDREQYPQGLYSKIRCTLSG